MSYFNHEVYADERFFRRLAKVAREHNQPLPTLSEVLDTIKLTLNQYAEELLSDLQGVRVEKLVAQLYEYPEPISSSDSPSQLSQLLVPECCQSFAERSESYELDHNRKLMLTEILTCVAYVSISREEYLSDAPAKLYIDEIIPDLVPAPPPAPKPEKPIILASYPPTPDDLGYIILLNLFDYLRPSDIEKGILLNLNPFHYDETPEKFLGFCQVPPGTHSVEVRLLDEYHTTWCYLQPRQVLVLELKSAKRSYRELRFFEANLETTAHYQNLATTGALSQAVLPYIQDLTGEEPWYRSKYRWSLITQHIRPPQFPPTLQIEQLGTTGDNWEFLEFDDEDDVDFGSDDERIKPEASVELMLKLPESHGGDLMAFLAEFEFAFASGKTTFEDLHTDRWNQLLQVLCYSGQEGIAYLGERLPEVIDIVMVQIQRVLISYLHSHREIFDACQYLSDDLVKSAIPIAVEKGQELADCVEDKKQDLDKYVNSGRL